MVRQAVAFSHISSVVLISMRVLAASQVIRVSAQFRKDNIRFVFQNFQSFLTSFWTAMLEVASMSRFPIKK